MKILPLLLLLATPPVWAQNKVGSEEARKDQLGSHLFSSTLNSPARFSRTQVLLQGSVEKQVAAANVGFTNGDTYANFKAQGTLKDDAKDVGLITLEGFQKGITGSVGAGHVWWNPTANINIQTQVCVAYFMSQGKTAAEARNEVCTLNKLPKDSEYRQFLNALSDVERREICKQHYLALGRTAAEIPTLPCRGDILSTTSYYDQYDDAIDWGPAILMNLEGSLNGAKYQYASEATLAEAKENHTNYEGTGTFGVLWGVTTFLGVHYTYGSQYEDADSEPADICTPLTAVTGALRCKNLSVGKPNRSLSSAITAEFNHEFVANILGINPQYTYDVREKQHAIKVPINFLRSENGLLGGIALGWESKEREFKATLFIGHIRSFFP